MFYASNHTSIFPGGRPRLLNLRRQIPALIEEIENYDLEENMKRPDTSWTFIRLCSAVVRVYTIGDGMPLGDMHKFEDLPKCLRGNRHITTFRHKYYACRRAEYGNERTCMFWNLAFKEFLADATKPNKNVRHFF